MSIAASAIGEAPVAAQAPIATGTSTKKTPPKRRTTAKADVIDQPEAR